MLSEKVYTDENIVIEISDKYDWLIVGSDQIWNPICSDFSWTYLLEGISGNKISYSPSLGDSKFKGDEEQKFMNCLKNFSKVSVRELRAADHIKEASQFTINPEVLPDPTFLSSNIADALLKSRAIASAGTSPNKMAEAVFRMAVL